MSSASGEVPKLSLPTQPKDLTNTDDVTQWLVQVQLAINNWANRLIVKISEMENISKTGEGLDLPLFQHSSGVTKVNATIVSFSNDPDALGRGPGLYRYNGTTQGWDKA